MRLDLPELLPLVCPACAARSERGLELRTLAVEARVALEGGELLEGVLRCTGCARRYPVLDGTPAIFRDLAPVAASLLSRPAPPEVVGLLAESGTDDSPVAREAASLGSYLDASWGDCAEPPPEGPSGVFGFAALAGKLEARANKRVGRALELGCGVGRALSLLARGADLCVGLDSSPAALRCARRILAGGELAYARRITGRRYGRATIQARAHAAAGVQLFCADASSPPLAPASFDRVAALNLLDTVHSPGHLLQVAAGLVAPGGELLLCAPYAWKSGITEEAERLPGDDPARAIREALERLGLALVEEDLHVPWLLRRDARAASAYDVHWLRATRPA